jgi:hypothetical protein
MLMLIHWMIFKISSHDWPINNCITFNIIKSSFLFVCICIIIFIIIKRLTVLRHQVLKPSFKFCPCPTSNIRINLKVNPFKLVLTSNIAIRQICFKTWIVI